MTVTLEALWSVADSLALNRGKNPKHVLDPCGLLLERPLRRLEYFCTPANSETFARTGGDGVHYGFLRLQPPFAESPIVMTVPMGNHYNIVIAESFSEFLGLGYFNGWFALEQLAYNPEEAVRLFAGPDGEDIADREPLLKVLRATLGIVHIPLTGTRIGELQVRYGALIQLAAGT